MLCVEYTFLVIVFLCVFILYNCGLIFEEFMMLFFIFDSYLYILKCVFFNILKLVKVEFEFLKFSVCVFNI